MQGSGGIYIRMPVIRYIRYRYYRWRVYRWASKWAQAGVGLGMPSEGDMQYLEMIRQGQA